MGARASSAHFMSDQIKSDKVLSYYVRNLWARLQVSLLCQLPVLHPSGSLPSKSFSREHHSTFDLFGHRNHTELSILKTKTKNSIIFRLFYIQLSPGPVDTRIS